MTPQHRQQLEELAKWHEEEAGKKNKEKEEFNKNGNKILRSLSPIDSKVGVRRMYLLAETAEQEEHHHRNAAKLLREVVEL